MMKLNRRSALAVFGAAVLWLGAGFSGDAMTFDKMTHLKFSGPVALPGVALGAGDTPSRSPILTPAGTLSACATDGIQTGCTSSP